MATAPIAPSRPATLPSPVVRWLMNDQPQEIDGPYEHAHERTTPIPGGR